MNQEEKRLKESHQRKKHWKRWGPYLSERAWGTVREDYSPHGTAWDFLPHDAARSKAYRWNEDGLAGISDRHQLLCFALALWNGKDAFLKERAFGLTGSQGNHGEDCKDYYYYLDSTPTHSYMRYLYKYPQAAFPYEQLILENGRRSRAELEYELIDTGVFDDDRYFDVTVEYAKADVEDILIRITVRNQGPEAHPIHVLPTLWYRNTWSWGRDHRRPELSAGRGQVIEARHHGIGRHYLHVEGTPELLFTENETNYRRLYGARNNTAYLKDGINDYVVEGRVSAINPERHGTKAAAHYRLLVPGRSEIILRLRLTNHGAAPAHGVTEEFDAIFALRQQEADEFYAGVIPAALSADERNVMRQALAGLLFSKQYYHYVVSEWLSGDSGHPAPPAERLRGRNREWTHLYNADVISMPDKWEYPWYAAWDLAFHCIPLAIVDPDFAKEQLILLLREWYMHPNGQIPAYEWHFGDVNPPVHAWAAWRVYKIDKARTGVADRRFLSRIFQKLMLNFTWWVNRKDKDGRNVFQGGFLGLDNIGVFDRSAPLPTGGYIEQSDGTSWMAMYCLNMLAIAMELATEDESYEDVASKFWEHFVFIAHAMNTLGLWDHEDGFYYDVLALPDGAKLHMKIRSMVGLIPLFAVETIDAEQLDRLPAFKRRMEWFLDNRPDLVQGCADMRRLGQHHRRLMSVVNPERLRHILHAVFDEHEFLSDYGVRSLSAVHRDRPYVLHVDGVEHRVAYEPAESQSGLFGGNSNWRGPIWMPMNYLLIEALQKFHYYLGDDFRVEVPTGSRRMVTLWDAAAEISRRLCRIFLRDERGRRPVFGATEKFQSDPAFSDLILFYEYFHGDNGAGIGASHQTGWTALIAKLLRQTGMAHLEDHR